jgi:hypothetical protein
LRGGSDATGQLIEDDAGVGGAYPHLCQTDLAKSDFDGWFLHSFDSFIHRSGFAQGQGNFAGAKCKRCCGRCVRRCKLSWRIDSSFRYFLGNDGERWRRPVRPDLRFVIPRV